MDRTTRDRAIALACAVVHHGLACLAEGAIPTGSGKVIATAEEFRQYLDTGEIPERRSSVG